MKRSNLVLLSLLFCASSQPIWADNMAQLADSAKTNPTALASLRVTAENGNPEAELHLGILYVNGAKTVPKNEAQAAKWWRKASDQGNVKAQYGLGVLYAKGWGVSQDYKLSAVWWRKAAGQGFADAQYNLGSLFLKGPGVTQNDSEAAFWYRKAADQNVPRAQVKLGALYISGRGVPQDYVQAYKWFSVARAQGDTKAGSALEIMDRSLTPSQIAEGRHLSAQWLANHHFDKR